MLKWHCTIKMCKISTVFLGITQKYVKLVLGLFIHNIFLIFVCGYRYPKPHFKIHPIYSHYVSERAKLVNVYENPQLS